MWANADKRAVPLARTSNAPSANSTMSSVTPGIDSSTPPVSVAKASANGTAAMLVVGSWAVADAATRATRARLRRPLQTEIPMLQG